MPPYSPRLRTALVLTGTGTAGAYHAGVLHALHEAGVRIDLVAARGAGAIGAMFAAADAGPKLWDADGLWPSSGEVKRLYRLKPVWRLLGWTLAATVAVLLLPVALVLAVALLYPLALVLQLVSPETGAAASDRLSALFSTAIGPAVLATLVPRLVTVAVLVVLVALVAAWAESVWGARGRRRARGAAWWRALGAPLDASRAVRWATDGFWSFIRGAAPVARPPLDDLSRRYSELVAENLGQPGYRELLLTVHDLDIRRDLVFALLGEPWRSQFFRDDTGPGGAARSVELIDLAGVGRDYAMDALAGALSVPVATDPHVMAFPPESYWRGEAHRLCDRPGALARLLEEVARAGVEQVIVVSAASDLEGPHGLTPARLDLHGRLGEFLAGADATDARLTVARPPQPFVGLYTIRPHHNAVGPLDVGGAYDERSDRTLAVRELMDRGYQDAYVQFIDPVIGASGEGLGRSVHARREPSRTPSSILADELTPREPGPADIEL